MEDVLKMLNLSDDNEIFRGYATIIELYNTLKFITMLFFIKKILTSYLGVVFLKSVSIFFAAGRVSSPPDTGSLFTLDVICKCFALYPYISQMYELNFPVLSRHS